LEKKSPKSFALFKWQERYVRLTKDGLYYYKRKDQPPQGAIPLHCIDQIQSDPLPEKQRTFRMNIVLEKHYGCRVFSFIAKTEAEIVAWKNVLGPACSEAKRNLTSQQRINAAAIADQGGNKIWKIQPIKGGTTDEGQGTGGRVRLRNTDQMLKQMFEGYMQSTKALYQNKPTAPTMAGSIFDNLEALSHSLFGDYRIEADEQSTDLGSIFIVGNQHYNMTHHSYLLHAVYRTQPYFQAALGSMELSSVLAKFPLFPQQIHCGQTRDAIYAVYHPPVRTSHDSLFAWLSKVEVFPEHIIAWIAAHLILAVNFLHSMETPLQLTTLSPEIIFFDGSGQVRICDPLLHLDPLLSNTVPEYTPPEVLHDQIVNGLSPDQFSPPPLQSDFWRLGVLLYELATGLPPFRPQRDFQFDEITQHVMIEYRQDVYNQIQSLGHDLPFPPNISIELRNLIQQLLSPTPSNRLTSLHLLQSHSFFQKQYQHLQITQQQYNPDIPPLDLWNLESLITSPRPPWVDTYILTPLFLDPNTPQNLTFEPSPVPVQRLTVNISQIRHLPREFSQRTVCHITVANEQKKSEMGSCVNSELIDYGGSSVTFDVLQSEISTASDILIEVSTLQTSGNQKSNTQQQNQATVTASKAQFVGLVTYPLKQIQSLGEFHGWLTIFDIYGLILGEIQVSLIWEAEYIPLSQQVLSSLTNTETQFAEQFGKPIPQFPRKLSSLILDPSTLSMFESQHDPKGQHLNTIQMNTMQMNTLTMQSSLQQPLVPNSIPKGPSSLLPTMKLTQNSSNDSSNIASPNFNAMFVPPKPSTSIGSGSGVLLPMSSSSSSYIVPMSRLSRAGLSSSPNTSSLPPSQNLHSQFALPPSSSSHLPTPHPHPHPHPQTLPTHQNLPPIPPISPTHTVYSAGSNHSSTGDEPTIPSSLHSTPSSMSSSNGSSSSSLPTMGQYLQQSNQHHEIDSSPPPPPPPPDEPPIDPDSLPSNWRAANSPNGIYYFNKVTRITTWDPPACLVNKQ
jgi:hypothetical protein